MNRYYPPGVGNQHKEAQIRHHRGQQQQQHQNQHQHHSHGRPHSQLQGRHSYYIGHGGFQQGQMRQDNYYNSLQSGGDGYGGNISSPHMHISSPSSSNSGHLPATVPTGAGQLVPLNPATPKSNGFSLANLVNKANLNDIKGYFDRIGGLDGILSTVSKVQKVIGGVSQMAPLVKVLWGSFGSKKSSSGDESKASKARPRSRKRRRTGGKPSVGKSRRRNQPRKK